mgnify:CR=1 FL=1
MSQTEVEGGEAMSTENDGLLMDDADRLLSVAEVAARMRTTQPFVRELIMQGFLGAIAFGKNRRVPKSELTRFFAAYLGEDLQELVADSIAKSQEVV